MASCSALFCVMVPTHGGTTASSECISVPLQLKSMLDYILACATFVLKPDVNKY